MSKIYTLTGCSGAGKNTIASALFDIEHTIVSVTTRHPRPGEIDGYDYYFISQQAYHDAKVNGNLVEAVQFDQHSYGITNAEINHKLEHGDCVLIADPDGIEHLLNSSFKHQIEPIILITDREKVFKNLKHRNDDETNIQHRLSIHDQEINNIKQLVTDLHDKYHITNYHVIDTSLLNKEQLIDAVKNIIQK